MAPFVAVRRALALFIGFGALAQLAGALSPASAMRRGLGVCNAFEDACAANESCIACLDVFKNAVEACEWYFEASYEEFSYSYSFDAANNCDESQAVLCCAIDAAEKTDCQMTDMLLALYDCDHEGCGHSLGDCPGDAIDPSTATTSSTTSAATCEADRVACNADSACSACIATFVDAVYTTCGGPDFESATSTCNEIEEVFCCAIYDAEDSAAGCASNDLWLATYDCEHPTCGHSANGCPDLVVPATADTGAA